MTLSETLRGAFDLSKRTLTTSGVLVLALVLPASALMGMVAQGYFSTIVSVLSNLDATGAPENEMVQRMFGQMALMGGLSMLYYFALLLVQTTATILSWEGLNEEETSIMDALRRAFRRDVWYTLLQTLMMGGIFGVAYFAILIATLILGALAGALSDSGAGAIGGIMIMLVMAAFFGGIIFFIIATIFRVHLIVIDERGPWKGLIASIALVKGHWWRVFGTLVLTQILIWLIMLPLSSIMWSDLSGVFAELREMTADNINSRAAAANMLETISELFSWKFFLLIGLQASILWFFGINVLTTLYAQLKGTDGKVAGNW